MRNSMTNTPVNGLIQHFRRAALLQGAAGMSDGQLLRSHLRRGETAALEAIVQRHASMVWGICRRALHNHHDAEDAFQATFIVLVRKAATVRPREMVGNWLYGVAHQTAIKAKATAARRRMRERQMAEMPEPEAPCQDLGSDLQPLLDQELSRLPDKYRLVIVLCVLEGRPLKEVAGQLGRPIGTVASRLARARTMLAKRLTRLGLVVSGGALAAGLSQATASACVPPAVVSSTMKAVTLVAAGQTATVGVIPASVAVLTDGVLKTMLLNKQQR
jgi:RNA polymerase sigma factor (sigma-70 family)